MAGTEQKSPNREGQSYEPKHLHDFSWLVVEPTHLKNIRQNWNLPQIGVKIKTI